LGTFAQAEIWVTDEVQLALGVRRDRSVLEGRSGSFFEETKQSAWSPRASITWRFSDNASAYASYSRGIRFPNLDETFGFFGFSPGLRPEKSKNYEIGAKWRSARAELNAAVYHMDVSDEIFFNPFSNVSAFGRGQNENIARTRHRGVELQGRIVLTEWLSAYGSYTYDDVEVRRDAVLASGSRIPITPRHRGTLGLEAALPWGFDVGVNANYVGSRPVANSIDGTDGSLGKYATYDARVGWSHAIELQGDDRLKLQIDAVGQNLLDREYSDFAGFSTFSFFVGSYPAADRHYLVSARVSWEH
jgi:iron complex outermembrane receptor protein